jgi:hypothetical protein
LKASSCGNGRGSERAIVISSWHEAAVMLSAAGRG